MPRTASAPTDRPANKMDAVRLILERDPTINYFQLQAAMLKEFRMHMSNKMAQNYHRDTLKKMAHPTRPTRSSNGAPSVPDTQPSQLEELMRLGNSMGWDEVKRVAEIASMVQK